MMLKFWHGMEIHPGEIFLKTCGTISESRTTDYDDLIVQEYSALNVGPGSGRDGVGSSSGRNQRVGVGGSNTSPNKCFPFTAASLLYMLSTGSRTSQLLHRKISRKYLGRAQSNSTMCELSMWFRMLSQ